MSDLSPEAVEATLTPEERAEAHGLLEGLAPIADQYAGLTPLEAAAAATSAHMSTCNRRSRLECVDCAEELHVIRRYLAAVEPIVEEQAYRSGYGDGRLDEAFDLPLPEWATSVERPAPRHAVPEDGSEEQK